MAAATGPVRLELAGETVLLLEDGHCFREQKLRFYSKQARGRVGCPRDEPLHAGADSRGRGGNYAPATAPPRHREPPRTALIRRLADAPFRTVGLVWRNRSPLLAALRKLAEKMRTALPGVLDALLFPPE